MTKLRKAYFAALNPHPWDDAAANRNTANQAIADAENEIELLRAALSMLMAANAKPDILPSSQEGIARSFAASVLQSPSCL